MIFFHYKNGENLQEYILIFLNLQILKPFNCFSMFLKMLNISHVNQMFHEVQSNVLQ